MLGTVGDRPAIAAGTPVPVEYVGRARALREMIAKEQQRYAAAVEKIIKPMQPRPAWPAPTAPRYLRRMAREFSKLKSPCRIIPDAEYDGEELVISDLVATASSVAFDGWVEAEPSLRLTLHILRTPPYEYGSVAVAEIGLHALARRYQRGRPATDGAVLRDLRPFLGAFRRAIETSDAEFRIATGAGAWFAQLSADRSTIVARTFIY
jgi:hypothetical protein